jgi:hypothetical protein
MQRCLSVRKLRIMASELSRCDQYKFHFIAIFQRRHLAGNCSTNNDSSIRSFVHSTDFINDNNSSFPDIIKERNK